MTVTHDRWGGSPFTLASHQINFPGFDGQGVTLAHYPSVDALAVAVDDIQIAELDLKEFKKFARKVLADELAEPPAPEWHDAKVIRGKEGGRTRLFLKNASPRGEWITDHGVAWTAELIAEEVTGIEVVVGADDE